jgi:hypothetical protein
VLFSEINEVEGGLFDISRCCVDGLGRLYYSIGVFLGFVWVLRRGIGDGLGFDDKLT